LGSLLLPISTESGGAGCSRSALFFTKMQLCAFTPPNASVSSIVRPYRPQALAPHLAHPPISVRLEFGELPIESQIQVLVLGQKQSTTSSPSGMEITSGFGQPSALSEGDLHPAVGVRFQAPIRRSIRPVLNDAILSLL
jgi:hypothetical protein